MGFDRTIICLAASRKPGGRCIAGKDMVSGEWVRPVSARPTHEISLIDRRYIDGSEPQLRDLITIRMLEEAPNGHQVENEMIDAEAYWTRTGVASWRLLTGLVDAPETLWTSGYSSRFGQGDKVPAALAATMRSSLAFVRPQRLQMRVLQPNAEYGSSKRVVRGKFIYNDVYYDFKVTDPVTEAKCLARPDGEFFVERESYLTVSLGEVFTDGYAYKLIAGIFTEDGTLE